MVLFAGPAQPLGSGPIQVGAAVDPDDILAALLVLIERLLPFAILLSPGVPEELVRRALATAALARLRSQRVSADPGG